MVDKQYLLDSKQMARFVAQGYLRFDELIPSELNEAIMEEIDAGKVKAMPAGTPLSECYPEPSAVGHMLRMPELQGIIYSLVGPDPLFDHHIRADDRRRHRAERADQFSLGVARALRDQTKRRDERALRVGELVVGVELPVVQGSDVEHADQVALDERLLNDIGLKRSEIHKMVWGGGR